MCICMIFTLLPFSALAEGTRPFTVTEENSVRGAEMRKTITQDSSDPDKYTVTLEQWATGTVSTKQKPLDIVLVLDVSGSMDEKFGGGNTKKIASLKNSVNSFIDNIASKATDEVTHKIAIVKFAGDKTKKIGNDMYTEGIWPFDETYNYTQIVKDLTLVKGNTADLKNAVNKLRPAGATAADWGLEKAKEAFGSETADPSRQRVVIMFTDGEPNHDNGFDNGVAKAAIGHANSLKNKYSSLVYTIGIFSGANVSDMNGKTNRYMNLVSSNYPNATDMNTDGTGSNQGYYKKADNADELQSAFDNISTSIGQSGSSLDSTSVLTDEVAPNFIAPANANEVKLYTAAYNGTSFGERTEYTEAKVNIGQNGAVTVTGFDYSANFVSDDVKTDGTYGKKLIVEFTIKVDRTKTYGGTQQTNTGANIVLGEETIIEVDNPKVPVSIDYEFKAIADKTKTYDGSGFDIGAEIGGMLTNNPPVGTKNGHVTITYTITDSDGKKIGTYTIPAGQATGTWEAAEGVTDTTTPADAGEYKYTVKCTMSDAYGSAAEKTATGTAKFVINKRSVTLTSGSAERQYDGTALINHDVTVGGDGFVTGEGATYNVTGSQTDVGESDNEFTYKLNEGTNAANYEIETFKGKLKVTPITDEVTVTITGNTKTVTYNGTEQSVTGYATDVGTKPITVTLKEGSKAEAKGTDVHKYMMGLTAEDFNVTSENYSNIKVVVVDGYLDITPITDEVTVKITGNNKTVTYNGKEQSVTGYTTDVGTKPITVTLKEGSKAEAKGTDVHKYMMGLTAEDFNVTSENYSNIKVVVVDGYLEITPIMTEVTVKITGNNKTVTYNGKEQSVTGYATDVGDKPITVALKGGKVAEAKGTDVGTYYMQLTAADFVVTSDIYANIKVIVEDGWLKINRRPMPPVNPPIMDEIIVEITGNSDSVVYDGTEHSVKGYTVKISDPRYTEADFTFTGKAEASGVNAGTYEMGLKAEQFKNTNARFTNVKFVIKADGVLTITPKELIITAGSKTEYGPTPVTCGEWTVSGLAAGDKVESVKITGIQSVPGSSPNVPSDAVIKNAKGEDVTKNYAIKYVNGTLTMLEVLNKEDHFNYIIGTPEGLSLPTANVTRAEVATIFFRLMTDDARAKFDSLDNNFSDVAKGKWYNRAISTLAKAGIIKGDPAGTYRPGDPITRAEMAAIIARFGDFKEGGKTFNDISGHWAQKYIELAASNGWINGNPDGTFKPNNNITRAETVAMINRVLDRQTKDVSDLLPVAQMTNWSDNMDTAKWYYRDMQEATNNHKAERVGNSIYEKWTEKLPDIDWASYQI